MALKKWPVSQEIVDRCVADLLKRVEKLGYDYSGQPPRWIEYQALRIAGYVK